MIPALFAFRQTANSRLQTPFPNGKIRLREIWQTSFHEETYYEDRQSPSQD